jgi:hypothetical protein
MARAGQWGSLWGTRLPQSKNRTHFGAILFDSGGLIPGLMEHQAGHSHHS